MKFAEQAFIATVNHVLVRSPWATERLQPFAGSAFRIDASPVRLDSTIAPDGLLDQVPADVEPEVTLRLPFSELPGLLAGGMDKLMSRVRLDGNAELAETLGFVFRNIEWDVEEDLSKVLGDAPAHRIASAARGLHAMQKRGLEAVQNNLAEYLTEESDWIPQRTEVERLRSEIVELRDATARLDKRIERLGRKR